jgi:hypothetical protein
MRRFLSRHTIIVVLTLVLSVRAESQWRQSGQYLGYVKFVIIDSANLLAGGWQGVFLSTDKGASWSPTSINRYVSCLTLVDRILYAACDDNFLYASTNHGASWYKANTSSKFPDPYYVKSIVAMPDGNGGSIFFASNGPGIYTSPDKGTTWNYLVPWLYGTWVDMLAVSGPNLLAASARGILLSTDMGRTWANVNSQTQFLTLLVQEGSVYASGYNGLYRSSDNGVSWTFICSSPAGPPVSSLALRGSYFFAGVTGASIYLSMDGGHIWRIVQPWVGTTPIVFNCLTLLGDTIMVGTDLRIWRRSLREQLTSIERSRPMFEDTFSLCQNYPNPFNPSTEITYAVPRGSRVVLTIADALGRVQAVLVDGEKPAGTYSVSWNASQLPSGTYFYRLQAGDFVETRKMILMK